MYCVSQTQSAGVGPPRNDVCLRGLVAGAFFKSTDLSSTVVELHNLVQVFIPLWSILHCYKSAYNTQATLRKKELGIEIFVLELS